MKLKDQPYYKIGLTNNVSQRLAALQTGTPFDIELVCLYDAETFDTSIPVLERTIQALFYRFHYRREWYTPDGAALSVLLNEERLFEAVWHFVKHGTGAL